MDNMPSFIYQTLQEMYGETEQIKKLNGIKPNGGCYRFQYPAHSVIVKFMDEHAEWNFYKEYGNLLKESGVSIPNLIHSFKDESLYALVLEDIPNALPQERWTGDRDILGTLHKLHLFSQGKSLSINNHYIPEWNDKHTEKMLNYFSGDFVKEVKDALYEIQQKSQHLFLPLCWINADTNPTNWGIRKDGQVVLFDWERITVGSPAIDIAITIPGLGSFDRSLELQLAIKYLSYGGWVSDYFTIEQLSEDINLAKLWSTVEYISNHGMHLEKKILDYYKKNLTGKIKMLS